MTHDDKDSLCANKIKCETYNSTQCHESRNSRYIESFVILLCFLRLYWLYVFISRKSETEGKEVLILSRLAFRSHNALSRSENLLYTAWQVLSRCGSRMICEWYVDLYV